MNSKHIITNFTEAFDLHPEDTIALVGAGGKTSLMFNLAEELLGLGKQVVVTTTTKIGTEEHSKHCNLVIGNNLNDQIREIQSVWKKGLIPVVASKVDEKKDRLIGIDSDTANNLANECNFLLIEADGAKRKPFKIPMAHEPVVPECVNKLCIVVGLDALGIPLNEQNFYNVDGMIELGVKPNEPLTPSLMFKLLFHPNGYTRFKTNTRQLFLILNKFDVLPESYNIQEISTELYHNTLEKILFTSTKETPIVRALPDNKENKIAGVILAAGKASRFGGLKQCAKIGERVLINHVTYQVINSDLNELAVVLGYKKDEVMGCLEEFKDNDKLSIIENDEYENGLSTSLKRGLGSLEKKSDAVMFILGDQPRVNTEFINSLIEAYKSSNAQLCIPMVPTKEGSRPGNPVIIGRKLYPDLWKITGDTGAREVVRDNFAHAKIVQLENDNSQIQINTQDDLQRYNEAMK